MVAILNKNIKISGIYILIDPNTNEIRYCGKSNNVFVRSYMHLQPSIYKNKSFPVYNWIRKLVRHGALPKVGIIQTFSNISNTDLNKCEIYWIDFFKKNGCKLLNATIGGEGIGGRQWNKKDYERICKKIISCDNVIYNSIADAERKLNIAKGCISQNLSGKSYSAGSKSFKYLEDFKKDWLLPPVPKIPKNLPKKIYDQYGNEYATLREASLKLNLNLGHIGEVLKGARRHVKGYIFSYTSSNLKLRDKLPQKYATPIINNLGEVFDSQMHAARELNIRSKDINAVLRGRQKTAKGYSFQYLEKKCLAG